MSKGRGGPSVASLNNVLMQVGDRAGLFDWLGLVSMCGAVPQQRAHAGGAAVSLCLALIWSSYWTVEVVLAMPLTRLRTPKQIPTPVHRLCFGSCLSFGRRCARTATTPISSPAPLTVGCAGWAACSFLLLTSVCAPCVPSCLLVCAVRPGHFWQCLALTPPCNLPCVCCCAGSVFFPSPEELVSCFPSCLLCSLLPARLAVVVACCCPAAPQLLLRLLSACHYQHQRRHPPLAVFSFRAALPAHRST